MMGNDPITGACDVTSQTPATRPRPELEEHLESTSTGGWMADQAGAAKEKLKQKGREAANRVSAAVDDASQQVKEQAGEATRRVKDQGATLLAQQKDRLASEIEHFSAAAHEAASKLDEEEDRNVAHYLHVAADRIDGIAAHMRDSNISRLVDDASHMARRRPEVFFGGMFIAGMALARFLKASGTPRHRTDVLADDFDELDESEIGDEDLGAGISTVHAGRSSAMGRESISTGSVGGTTGSTSSLSGGSLGASPATPGSLNATEPGSLNATEEKEPRGDKLAQDRGPCPPGSAGQEVL